MVKESTYQTKVLKILRDRGAYVETIWGGGYQASGIPDIVGVYKGVFLGLELKVKSNKPSPIQVAKINMIRKAQGVGAIIWDNFEPIHAILDSIDKGEPLIDKYTVKGDSYDGV